MSVEWFIVPLSGLISDVRNIQNVRSDIINACSVHANFTIIKNENVDYDYVLRPAPSFPMYAYLDSNNRAGLLDAIEASTYKDVSLSLNGLGYKLSDFSLLVQTTSVRAAVVGLIVNISTVSTDVANVMMGRMVASTPVPNKQASFNSCDSNVKTRRRIGVTVCVALFAVGAVTWFFNRK